MSITTSNENDYLFDTVNSTIHNVVSLTANQNMVLDVSGNITTSATPLGGVTSINISGGTTGITATGGPITSSGTITLGGTLIAANGGTGQSSFAVGDLLYADTTSTLAKLPDVAAGSFLRAGGVNTAPSWSTVTIPNTVSANRLLLTNSNAIVTSNAPSNGQIPIGTTGAGFSLNTITAGSNVTITNGAGSITVAAPSVVKTAATIGTTTAAVTDGTSTFPVGYTIPANTFATNGDSLEFYYTFSIAINSGAPNISYEFGPSSGSSPFALFLIVNSTKTGSGFLRVTMIRTSTTQVTMRYELIHSDGSVVVYMNQDAVTYTGGFASASASPVGLKFSNISGGASSAQITTYGSRVVSYIQ